MSFIEANNTVTLVSFMSISDRIRGIQLKTAVLVS